MNVEEKEMIKLQTDVQIFMGFCLSFMILSVVFFVTGQYIYGYFCLGAFVVFLFLMIAFRKYMDKPLVEQEKKAKEGINAN